MNKQHYFVSSFFYGGKQLVAESGRRNKRSAARAIANYLNSKDACSWHTFSVAEVYETLVPFSIESITKFGVGHFRFILY